MKTKSMDRWRLLLLVMVLHGALGAQAKVPSEFEATYLQAVLSFNERKYLDSLQILNELITQSPDTFEFLELRALALKSHGLAKDSLAAYKRLVAAKRKAKAPQSEVAPYYFEIGMLYFKNEKFTEAKRYLTRTARFDFNPGATHLVLGLIASKDADWAAAEDHLKACLREDIAELNPVAHFYLAQAYLKAKAAAKGTFELSEAKAQAEALIADTKTPRSADTLAMSKQILEATNKALGPMDRGQWFGSASLRTGYDSNVFSSPEPTASSTSSSTSTLGKSSIIETLQASLGFMSSPLSTYQFVPSYRMSGSYNTNVETKSAEYFNQNLGLMVTRKPLAPFKLGLRLDGSYSFQNSTVSSSRFKYSAYSWTVTGGPYLKWEIFPRTHFGLQLGYGLQNFLQDRTAVADQKRSGTQPQATASIGYDGGSPYINPTLSGSYTLTQAKGSEFTSTAFNASLSNGLRFSSTLTATLGASLQWTTYPKRAKSVRKDELLTANADLSYRLNELHQKLKNFTLILDGRYLVNDSNIPTSYSYSKWTAGLSIQVAL